MHQSYYTLGFTISLNLYKAIIQKILKNSKKNV